MPQPDVEILQVQQDDLGPYAKIRVSLYGETTVIRWGLDPKTYQHLYKVVFTQAFADQTGSRYTCLISFDDTFAPGNPEGQAWLSCRLGSHTAKLSFGCTELFKSNLDWLRNINDVHALDALSWDAWFHSYYQRATDQAATPEPTTYTGPTHTWPILRIVSAAVALCLVIAAGWYGIVHLLGKHTPSVPMATNQSSTAVPAAQGTTEPPQTTQANTVTAASNPAPAAAPAPASESSEGSTKSAPPSTTNTTTYRSQPASATVPEVPPVPVPEVFQVPAGEVALTFDDGPNQYTTAIIQALASHHVHATFFFISNNADKLPDAVNAAVQAGDEIEDHSVSHPNLDNLSAADQKQQILQAALDLERYTHQPVGLFRPPYESFNNTTRQVINQLGMSLALWNRDPEDWNATSAQVLVDRIKAMQVSGAVIDLHDEQNTAEALPAILDYLASQHLHIVVLPDPLAEKAKQVAG